MTPEQEVLEIAKIIRRKWKVQNENEPIYIHFEELSEFPNEKSILRKIATQYEAIEIIETPEKYVKIDGVFDKVDFRFSSVDEIIQVPNWVAGATDEDEARETARRLQSYKIKVSQTFEEFYKAVSHEADGDFVLEAKPSTNIDYESITFSPKDYTSRTGVLLMNGKVEILIAKKRQPTRPDGTKYLQCHAMSQLFRNVNSLRTGITFSKFLGVHEAKIKEKQVKKIRNTVTEINKKVTDKGGPKGLIKIQGEKVFVNHSYL